MKFLTTLVMLVLSISLLSQENKTEKHSFTFEVDPLVYIFGGFGGHFGWAPKANKHFVYGIGFITSAEYPDFIVNSNEKNKDKGWNVAINQGLGFWSQYYFSAINKRWFIGLQLFTQEMELTNSYFPGQKDRTNIAMIAFQGGYVWYPFKRAGFYLKPWAGIGYQDVITPTFEPNEVTPDMSIGDRTYYLNNFMPFGTVHIGYKF